MHLQPELPQHYSGHTHTVTVDTHTLLQWTHTLSLSYIPEFMLYFCFLLQLSRLPALLC